MNKFTLLCLIVITILYSVPSYAEDSADDILKKMQIQNRESQQQIEASRLEWQQIENERLRSWVEFDRRNAELERLRAETERLQMLNQADDAAQKQQELTKRLEQAAQDSAQEAEDAAEDMRTQILQVEIKHKNQMFLVIIFLTITVFLWNVVKKYKKEGFMKDFEKFGIITILASIILILLVLMISEPWVERFDFIQNLMTSLNINLFYDEGYFISFPSKYAVLILITSAAYGLTTYLGITPPFKMKKNNEPKKTQDNASLE